MDHIGGVECVIAVEEREQGHHHAKPAMNLSDCCVGELLTDVNDAA
jgi:hypothetical protein